MGRFSFRVEESINFTDYTLLDDHGCVAAEVHSKNWGKQFRPTREQALAAFAALVPGVSIEEES